MDLSTTTTLILAIMILVDNLGTGVDILMFNYLAPDIIDLKFTSRQLFDN